MPTVPRRTNPDLPGNSRYLISPHRPNAHVPGTAHANQAHSHHDDGGDVDQRYEVVQNLGPSKAADVGGGTSGGGLGVHRTGHHHADNQSYHSADYSTDPRVQGPELVAQDQD